MTNTPKSNSLETKNLSSRSNRAPVGLMVASVATIAVSWAGMAYYMDYQLDQLRQGISSDTRSSYTASKVDIQNQIEGLSKTFNGSLNEKSSVLAKGILDLTKKEEEYQNATLGAITDTNSLITQSSVEVSKSMSQLVSDSQKQVNDLLAQNLQSSTAAITKAIDEAIQKQQTQFSESLASSSETLLANDNTILASLEKLDKNGSQQNTEILTRLDSSTQSLKDLSTLSQQNGEQLATLASGLETYQQEVTSDNKKASAQLVELANQVKDARTEIAGNQTHLSQLASLVPDMKTINEEQMKSLAEATKTMADTLQNHLSGVQGSMTALNQLLDQSTQNLLRALNSSSEGLETAKVELKSQVTQSDEQTSATLKQLGEQLQQMSQILEGMKAAPQTALNADLQSMPAPTEQMAAISSQVTTINEQVSTFKSSLSEHSQLAKELLEAKMNSASDESQKQIWQGLITKLSELSQEYCTQLDGISGNLATLSGAACPKACETGEGGQVTSEQTTQEETVKEIGMNPEERPVSVTQ